MLTYELHLFLYKTNSLHPNNSQCIIPRKGSVLKKWRLVTWALTWIPMTQETNKIYQEGLAKKAPKRSFALFKANGACFIYCFPVTWFISFEVKYISHVPPIFTTQCCKKPDKWFICGLVMPENISFLCLLWQMMS